MAQTVTVNSAARVPAPDELPNVTAGMQAAEFWISRASNPDGIVLDGPGINDFQKRLQNQDLVTDVARFPNEVSGIDLRKEQETLLETFHGGTYFTGSGAQPDAAFFDSFKKNMLIELIPDQVVAHFGFVTRYSDQRILPTTDLLTAKPGDVEFDELQESALDLGSPVVILWKTKDGRWLYCRGETSRGWILAENVALARRYDILEWYGSKNFSVVISPKAEVFKDKERQQSAGRVQMGARFPREAERADDPGQIVIPTRGEDGQMTFQPGFFKGEDVRDGYLPYTPRNILTQAFKMLGKPYGWGGMNGEQDCSRFLQQVFSTVGITLPRNSKEQIQVGERLGQFGGETKAEEKLRVLSEAPAAISFLGMPGHIMLFLGMAEDRPYAIHATWAYRERQGDADVARVINRIVVSDLSLGEGSRKGSLLERLNRVIAVK